MSRPEGTKAPQEYYDAREARKYNENSRIVSIQSEITQRAIQMLSLPATPCYILDGDLISTSLMIFIPTVGCGSGLSGETLEEAGHYWVGCDISSSMLELAAERESTTGDLLHSDIGQGTPHHPSIRILQLFRTPLSTCDLRWGHLHISHPMALLCRYQPPRPSTETLSLLCESVLNYEENS